MKTLILNTNNKLYIPINFKTKIPNLDKSEVHKLNCSEMNCKALYFG